ncbi:OmpA family protein [Aliikangiella sp. IMCC44359]|uniref:OmpA family protein n=1 Tax=Aliikangiella sp. IMCC44359 TaxID=3459125 RepID=UPI00403AE440
MKKVIVISTLLVTSIIQAGQAKASSKEENIGFASGALAGAAIGGPVGFLVGAVAGVLVGEQVEKAGRLDDVKMELELTSQREALLKEKLSQAEEMANSTETDWATDGLTLNLMFTTNSAELASSDYENIKQVASILSKYPELNIRLDGYSDPRGSKADNLTLSQQRVDKVKQVFESFGIDTKRLLGTAHGEIEVVAEQSNVDSYALARKVSVNFITQSEEQLAQN